MRFVVLFLVLALTISSGCGGPRAVKSAFAAEPADGEKGAWVTGKTQPAPGRVARIAPTVLHPVVEVRVKLGDRVKKTQPLVKRDDDEPQADVRAKKATHEELKAGLARLKEEPRHEEQNEARANLDSLKIVLEEAEQIFEK